MVDGEDGVGLTMGTPVPRTGSRYDDQVPGIGNRESFIDWMKAIGIALIVVGHVAGAPFVHVLPPIAFKQLGVAAFMFVLGYSLAGERRLPLQVVARRMSDVWFWGGATALLISCVMLLSRGRANLTNYLPLLFGVNVLFNFFPANPTTWYIGTYFHALLFWACCLRFLRPTLATLALASVLEVGLRSVLLAFVGGFVAYQALPNWTSVLLLGSLAGWRARQGSLRGNVWLWWGGALVVVAGWSIVTVGFVVDQEFPWMSLHVHPLASAGLVSASVTFLYLVLTYMLYRGALHAPPLACVRYLARNTLLVFILHMPLYYSVVPRLDRLGLNYLTRSAVLVGICLPLLAMFSERLRQLAAGPSLAWRSMLLRAVAALSAPRLTDRGVSR